MNEVAGRLAHVIEEHPTDLSTDADERVAALLQTAARAIAEDPGREAEAAANLRRLLDVAAGGLTETALTEYDIESALLRLCPIFPFC